MNHPAERESGITVGELLKQLAEWPKDDLVCFGPSGYFTFYRVKDRGGICQIEFNETPGADYELMPDHPYRQYMKEQGFAPGG